MNKAANQNSSAPGAGGQGDVAIIGMACTYPGARNVAEFWRNIVGGVNCIQDVPRERWDPDVFYDPSGGFEDRVYTKKGGFLGVSFAFNPLKYGTMPRAVEGAEPDQFLVMRTVHEAMEDAGYIERPINGERAAFILGRGNYLGAGVGGLLQRGMMTEQTLHIIKMLHPEFTPEQMLELKQAIRSRLPGFAAESAPGLIPNITTGRVANRLDLMGATYTIDAACASSLIATELAVRDLVTGRYDLMLAGGCHVCCEVPFLQVFAAMGALSRSSTIRPFDRDADGTLAGEGVGIIVLKRLADAERDGDRIYAVVKGVGTSSDGRAKGVTAPRVEGEVLALRRAYEMCGFSPDSVGLIEAHGTGTPVGDPTEVTALRNVFGPRRGGPRGCALGSIKSMIGHTMPAAGVAGIIKTALSLYHRVLPPSLNCTQPIDELVADDCPFYVNTELRPWVHGGQDAPRRAGVNAFGFGGVNAHVVLEDYRSSREVEAPSKAKTKPGLTEIDDRPSLLRELDSELLVIEGGSREALRAAVEKLRDYSAKAEGVALREVAWTLADSRRGGGHVLGIVASSLVDLKSKLTRAATSLADRATTQIKDAKGIYYFGESALKGGKVAFLFPGEGAQYLNMLADVCIHFPEVRSFFDAADRAVGSAGRYPLSADIFPTPLLSEKDLKAAEEKLWQIERATEAVLTADGAMYILLQRLGIVPDMITGHSAGEWVAMAASGILDFDEFVASAPRLGAVYGGLSGDRTIPKAAMLAVGTGRDEVIRLAREIGSTVHIANDNCPHQVVVVVAPEDAQPVTKHLHARGVFVERLPYDRGYHTPVFTYICEPLRKYFSSLKISPSQALLYSSTTAQPYPKDPKEILELVSHTFARTLIFRETITAMYDAGARIFLEVGPRGLLTGFVDDILRGRPHVSIAMNRPKRSGVTTLHHALAMLAALHVPMDLAPLYVRRSPRKLSFDPLADRPIDHDRGPGTMQVSLCYPHLELSAAPAWASARALETAEAVSTVRPANDAAPVPIPAAMQPKIPTRDESVAPSRAASTIIQAHTELMENFLQTHEEVMQAFLSGGSEASQLSAGLSESSFVARESQAAQATPPAPEGERDREGSVHSKVALGYTTAAAVAVSQCPEAIPKADAAGQSAAVEGEPLRDAPKPTERLEDVLVRIVSEKTGYPPEMLDLDLDMEADLGIDSIKRIEVLGALQQMGDALALSGTIDMEEVARLKTLRQIGEYLRQHSGAAVVASAAVGTTADASTLAFAGRIERITPGREVVVTRDVTLDEDLYLYDHCFDPPASEWDDQRDRLHVVPLTVSLEMMAEVASLLVSDRRVVGAKSMHASKWIEVHRGAGPTVLSITATRTEGADEVRVAIRQPDAGAADTTKPTAALAEATVVFATDFPAAPVVGEWQLRNPRTPACTAEALYAERRMFHGLRFQGVVGFDEIGEDGLTAQLEVLPRNDLLASRPSPRFWIDPVLLDAAGQMVGYWPIEYVTDGFMMFPIQIQEISLYREPLAPGTRSRCQVRIREIGQRQVRADIDIIAPDGGLCMRVRGWTDWRFYWERSFYDFWRFPDKGLVSEAVTLPLPKGCDDIECRRLAPMGEVGTSIWENLGAHLLLSQRELDEYRAMKDGPRRTEWIFGRAVAKDAVRAWLKRHHGMDVYPADVEIRSDANGRPYADGPWVRRIDEAPRISIAHKGAFAVAAAGRGVLGVDLESIESRDAGFDAVAFDDDERRLLERLDGT
ncbi:MAG: beta-ketoacyl synthase N-terminal-like domain-containing protein, partial [Phycisphaerales bacterium]|nr:beta-ketoacyl synthase N-terminal-like domain-containing protein [Phycisphaerales bacterium]